MGACQAARLCHTAGMSNHADFLRDALRISVDAMRLVSHIEAALQAFVMRGDAGRASIPVALKRLNTAERKHVSAGGGYEIRAGAECPCDFRRGNELAACIHADAGFEFVALQRVAKNGQAFPD